MKPIRLLLVDEHDVLRLGIRKLLDRSKTIRLVGEADSGARAVKQAERLRPDVVLMDLRLPDESGLETCRQLRALCPHTRIIFLTSSQDRHTLLSATHAGASGLVLKQTSGRQLIRSIETVAAGKSVIDPAMTEEFVQLISERQNSHSREVVLPTQQKRVLELLADGKTNREIAAMLALSEKTVINYIRIIFQKLGFTRRVQAAAYFIRNYPQQ